MIEKERFLSYLEDLCTLDEMDRKLDWLGYNVKAGAPSLKYFKLFDEFIYGNRPHFNTLAYWIDMGHKGEKTLAAAIKNDNGTVDYYGFKTAEDVYNLITSEETYPIVGIYGLDDNGNVILPKTQINPTPEFTEVPKEEVKEEDDVPCISQVEIKE